MRLHYALAIVLAISGCAQTGHKVTGRPLGWFKCEIDRCEEIAQAVCKTRPICEVDLAGRITMRQCSCDPR